MSRLSMLLGICWMVGWTGAQVRAADPDLDQLVEKRTFTREDAKLPYRFLKPRGSEAAGDQRYPLVIFLHGIGERGEDNRKQFKNGAEQFATEANREKFPCFLVVPQCPGDQLWSPIRGTRDNPAFADQPTEPAAMVLELIETLCEEQPIDRDRIYLVGLSMGGYGTWDLVCREPDRFAAAIPVCGGGDPAQAEKLTKLPLWVFHGDADTLVPPDRSRAMVEAIKQAGGEPKYTEYPGVGHDSWTATFSDEKVLEWLFSQKRPAAN